MTVVAVIPAHNEERTISGVVHAVKPHVDEVIVIDDGSTDSTFDQACQAGAAVWCQENAGPGSATRVGIKRALERYKADVVVCLDGDGQHDPDLVPDFLEALHHIEHDPQVNQHVGLLVVGQRELRLGRVPFLRWLGNRIFHFLRNFLSTYPVNDGQCGYRAFTSYTARCVEIETDGFGFAEEVIIKARSIGTVAEIEIPTRYGEEVHKYSFLPAMRRGLEIPWTILKWRWAIEWKPVLRRLVWERR